MGLLLPALVAFAMQLAQMLPLPVAVRLALPGYAFIAWNGLFTSPAQLGPLLIGIVVSLVWAVTATALAYLLFVWRDFTNLINAGSGIAQNKVQRSVATAFAHLYRLQAAQLNRPDVTEAQLAATATCNKGDGLVAAQGPGNDWRCVVSWHLPGVQATGTAIYQLDVTANGRYVADGDRPKDVNGYYQVRTPTGDSPNPLWQFDGNVELLRTAPKG